jgi:peptidoglycan hydrolase-like protein with peptidoglycan-binding domain
VEQQPRTLRLVSPFMEGPDVADVQRLLGVDADGEFGPITAGAVSAWKRARGDDDPTSVLTPDDQERAFARDS